MNRLAGELGLRETHFANTHGLPRRAATKPATWPRSLGSPWPSPTSPVVSRRQARLQVSGRQGHRRNVVWTNTNRLLETKG